MRVLAAEVSKDGIFFYVRPPAEILNKLREYGLEFEEHEWWCG